MDIQPTYVTFEQAKWLKEKGFLYKTYKQYSPNFNFLIDTDRSANCVIGGECAIKYSDDYCWAAPEQWQVIEWLRVNHGIWVYVRNFETVGFCSYILQKGESLIAFSNKSKGFEMPQEAYSAAFDYILTKLI
jgi:hypothetical protein